MEKAFVGKKHSQLSSPLTFFEQISVQNWHYNRQRNHIPEGFLFLAGVVRYTKKRRHLAQYKFGKEYVFIQSMLPKTPSFANEGHRGFGSIYSFYEPSNICEDDIVLSETGIYQAMPSDHFRLVLANGEHRQAEYVAQMFGQLCAERKFENFSDGELPKLYQVQFRKKSCGYFLKDRTYIVWAIPVGIPNFLLGCLNKGWIFCDIFCGIPSIIEFERETFENLDVAEGNQIADGLFIFQNNTLVFNQNYKGKE